MNIQAELALKAHHIIGKGSYGSVYYCTKPPHSQPYAVKVFHKKDFTKAKLHYFRKQAEILGSIGHPNIVKFQEFKETSNCIYILMEYIPGGTLKNFMKNKWEKQERFSDQQISHIINTILQGIQYLHKYNIIHRDLKPGMYFQYKLDNILLKDPDDLTSLKIVDFGLSAQLDSSYPKNVKAQCGTLLYMAPQIFYEPSYTKGVDIWSCAIIMYQLYTGGQHPIYRQGMKSDQFKQLLNESNFPALKDEMADNFIQKLSKKNYNERYSVNEALQHPWITRNEYDEIPLSVNQSISSFMFTHTIADVHLCLAKSLKFCLFLGTHNLISKQIPQDYFSKIRDIQDIQETNRSRSPSLKKMKFKRKQMKKERKYEDIFLPDKSEKYEDSELDFSSPLLRKHENLYLKLFEKQKGANEKSIELRECFEQTPIEKDIIVSLQKKFQEIETSKTEIQEKRMQEQENLSNSIIQLPSPLEKAPQRPGRIMKKTKSFREEGKGPKIDIEFNFNTDKYRNYRKNSIDLRTQSVRTSSKAKRMPPKNQMIREYILEPLSATRKTFFSKNNKAPKKPMTFGMGGNSYL